MTHSMPDTRLIVIALLLFALNLFIVVMYARGCYCECCPSHWAIWIRNERQLCRSCAGMFDRHKRRIARKRSVLRRLFRRAA